MLNYSVEVVQVEGYAKLFKLRFPLGINYLTHKIRRRGRDWIEQLSSSEFCCCDSGNIHCICTLLTIYLLMIVLVLNFHFLDSQNAKLFSNL